MGRGRANNDPDFAVNFKKLWDEGVSTNKMAERLNVTKNTICGYAGRRRELYPERGTPIRSVNGEQHTVEMRRRQSWQATREREMMTTQLQEAWNPWFQRQSEADRRAIQTAFHQKGCPAPKDGLWFCACATGKQDARPPGLIALTPAARIIVSPPKAAPAPAAPVLTAAPPREPKRPAVPESRPRIPPVLEATPAEHVRETEIAKIEADEDATAPTVFKMPTRFGQCCWPIGEPGSKTYRTCDDPITTWRRSYCDAHHKLGVTKLTKMTNAVVENLEAVQTQALKGRGKLTSFGALY